LLKLTATEPEVNEEPQSSTILTVSATGQPAWVVKPFENDVNSGASLVGTQIEESA
jgi:hypothetical protein